ncbi:MAG: 30S ribosomal protein S21 [Oligoflexus sp.]
MPGVRMKDGDNVERALKVLKKQVEKAGTISELKKRQHYEKPSIRKKKKEAAARKRLMKQIRKLGA